MLYTDDNNRIYRSKKGTDKSEVSMLSGKYLEDNEKIMK